MYLSAKIRGKKYFQHSDIVNPLGVQSSLEMVVVAVKEVVREVLVVVIQYITNLGSRGESWSTSLD